jgi:hypothetical protein
MNNSLKIVHELDPDGILDKNVNEESSFKRDSEATDHCHTLSSSDTEEKDRTDATEGEMEVDQPATPALPAAAIHGSESGLEPDLETTRVSLATMPTSDVAPTATAAIHDIPPTPETHASTNTEPTPSGSRSGSGPPAQNDEQGRGESISNSDGPPSSVR